MRAFALLMIVVALPAFAQKPAAYPSKNQTAQQQSTDDASCATWAKQNSGIDPNAPPPPTQTGPQGERLAGAARGAVAGAVVGEVANDDSSHGAKVGATAGVIAGGRASRRNQAARTQQAQSAQASKQATYWNAWGACMSGKGYSVK